MSKRLAAVDKSKCVACGVCECACTSGAVRVHRGCYAAVDMDYCVGCGRCATLCTTGCIEIKARTEA